MQSPGGSSAPLPSKKQRSSPPKATSSVPSKSRRLDRTSDAAKAQSPDAPGPQAEDDAAPPRRSARLSKQSPTRNPPQETDRRERDALFGGDDFDTAEFMKSLEEMEEDGPDVPIEVKTEPGLEPGGEGPAAAVKEGSVEGPVATAAVNEVSMVECLPPSDGQQQRTGGQMEVAGAGSAPEVITRAASVTSAVGRRGSQTVLDRECADGGGTAGESGPGPESHSVVGAAPMAEEGHEPQGDAAAPLDVPLDEPPQPPRQRTSPEHEAQPQVPVEPDRQPAEVPAPTAAHDWGSAGAAGDGGRTSLGAAGDDGGACGEGAAAEAGCVSAEAGRVSPCGEDAAAGDVGRVSPVSCGEGGTVSAAVEAMLSRSSSIPSLPRASAPRAATSAACSAPTSAERGPGGRGRARRISRKDLEGTPAAKRTKRSSTGMAWVRGTG